jgi:hypothetical protein
MFVVARNAELRGCYYPFPRLVPGIAVEDEPVVFQTLPWCGRAGFIARDG